MVGLVGQFGLILPVVQVMRLVGFRLTLIRSIVLLFGVGRFGLGASHGDEF